MHDIPYPVRPGKPVIYSVRHGESIGNEHRDSEDFDIYSHVSDPALWLTEKGQQQARDAGDFLGQHFLEMPPHARPQKIRFLRSSYVRARQTAENIEAAVRAALPDLDISVLEDERLRELEFGYGGYLDKPFEPHVRLSNQLRYQGYKYLAPRLGGESPASMEPRVRSVLTAIFRDFQENGITHFVVVNHGITSRVLTKAFCKFRNDWYEREDNPDNCAIRLLAEGGDHGYIFPNTKGQWDPKWEPEPSDAGHAKLNKHGHFLSPEEMEMLIEAQQDYPTILKHYIEARKTDKVSSTSKLIRSLTQLYT